MQAHPITIYLPDTRGVEVSPYGSGNLKLGFGVFTYSRLPGAEFGTCPGSTPLCESICYAKRVSGIVEQIWRDNTRTHGSQVPPIPEDCRLLRIHVSGDFDTNTYILNWVERLRLRPDVTAWAYTRSWRCPELLASLEVMRALPNMQLFASMDESTTDLPPAGWRRAWIATEGETRCRRRGDEHNLVVYDGTPSYVCPEETGLKPNCLACRYCFDGKRHDVTFLQH